MENTPRGHTAKEGEQAPRPKLKHVFRSIMGFTSKKRTVHHQVPPEFSNPQMHGVQELPDNQRISSYNPQLRERSPPQVSQPGEPGWPQASRRMSELNYLGTRGQDHMAEPHVNDARYSLQPLQERGPRTHTVQPDGIPSNEIIIALMGVTGKIQSLFKTCIDWLR